MMKNCLRSCPAIFQLSTPRLHTSAVLAKNRSTYKPKRQRNLVDEATKPIRDKLKELDDPKKVAKLYGKYAKKARGDESDEEIEALLEEKKRNERATKKQGKKVLTGSNVKNLLNLSDEDLERRKDDPSRPRFIPIDDPIRKMLKEKHAQLMAQEEKKKKQIEEVAKKETISDFKVDPIDGNMVQWLISGGTVLKNVAVCRRGPGDRRAGRRGVFATADIDANEIIAAIPYAYAFGHKDVDIETTRNVRELLPWGSKPKENWQCALEVQEAAKFLSDDELDFYCKVVLLIHEKEVNKEKSPWLPWIEALPLKENNWPYYTRTDMEMMQGTKLLEEVEVQSTILRKFAKVMMLLCKHHPNEFNPMVFTPTKLIWAASITFSRSLIDAMVPFLDLINHPDRPDLKEGYGSVNAQLEFATDKANERILVAFLIKSTRKIEKGEEIYISYRERPNFELAAQYGFILPAKLSPANLYDFTFDALLTPQLKSRLEMLRAQKPTGDVVLPEIIDKTVNGRVGTYARWVFRVPIGKEIDGPPAGMLTAFRCVYAETPKNADGTPVDTQGLAITPANVTTLTDSQITAILMRQGNFGTAFRGAEEKRICSAALKSVNDQLAQYAGKFEEDSLVVASPATSPLKKMLAYVKIEERVALARLRKSIMNQIPLEAPQEPPSGPSKK